MPKRKICSKEVVNVGSTRCLGGVFDSLTQFRVDVSPRVSRCLAFAHTSNLEPTFKFSSYSHPIIDKKVRVSSSNVNGGTTYCLRTMRQALHINVCGDLTKSIKSNFGEMNSLGLAGLASSDVKMEVSLQCSDSYYEMAIEGDQDNYTYVAYPSEIVVTLRFLSSLGWVVMAGVMPIGFHKKDIEAAFNAGKNTFKFEEKIGINWTKFSFDAEAQNFPLLKAAG